MSLFIPVEFVAHSGETLPFKIECDALTDDDLITLARQFARRIAYRHVWSVPTGGDRFANALRLFMRDGPVLIADDVLTTGSSIIEARDRLPSPSHAIGVVIFARGPCPDWVTPLFQMNAVLAPSSPQGDQT